jgi:hypothetical protein
MARTTRRRRRRPSACSGERHAHAQPDSRRRDPGRAGAARRTERRACPAEHDGRDAERRRRRHLGQRRRSRAVRSVQRPAPAQRRRPARRRVQPPQRRDRQRGGVQRHRPARRQPRAAFRLEEAGRLEVRRPVQPGGARGSAGAERRLAAEGQAHAPGCGVLEGPRCALAARPEPLEREQGGRAPVRHRLFVPVVARTDLRRQQRHANRVGDPDAARADRRQPQPARVARELRRRTPARKRGLPRLVLPQPHRQPAAAGAVEPEQCARQPAAARSRPAGHPEPAGGAGARQPGARDRRERGLQLLCQHAPELQGRSRADAAAPGLRGRGPRGGGG